MKKLVIVTYGMRFGGCEKVIANICNGFSEENIECTIITLKGGESVYPLKSDIKHIKVSSEGESVSGLKKIKKAELLLKLKIKKF